MNQRIRIATPAIILAGTLAATACSGDYRSHAGPVAARVNGQAIAAQRIDQQPANAPEAASLAALNALIDRELLVQKALEKRLDQDQAVQLEIEEAKRQILARTYVDRNMPAIRIDAREIQAFYRDNPALFSQRRLYRLDELIAAVDAAEVAEIRHRIAAGANLEFLASRLQQQHRAIRRVAAVKSSEALSPALLKHIEALQPGQHVVLEQGGKVSIIHLRQVQESPLTLAEASQAIERLLLEQKRQQFIRRTAEALRTGARIELLGHFAAQPETAYPALASGTSPGRDDIHLAKGLAGLL